MTTTLSHRLVRMTGRDPEETHRGATPLELLYDLTFVVAFGSAANEMAHYLAEGHVASAVWSFAFAVFAVSWAWINYSWFASAYDTDDAFVRIATLVQMIGVIILTLGLPAVFASIDAGENLDNAVVIAGYVVMRVPMIALWLRAARHDPGRRRGARAQAAIIGISQLGWIALGALSLPLGATFVVVLALAAVEMTGPIVIARRLGQTPWHPHHIAERYGLLVIITLGEVILGTTTAISVLISERGWSIDAIVVAFAGTTLAFTMWWSYFIMPSAPVLARYRGRAWTWGYGHLLIFGSIAAIGAGLHVAAYAIAGETQLNAAAVALTVAVPVGILSTSIFVIYSSCFEHSIGSTCRCSSPRSYRSSRRCS